MAALLAHRDPRISRTAGLALGALGAWRELATGLAHDRARTREAAAIGLGRLGGGQAAQALAERGRQDRDAVVRHACALALLSMQDQRGVDLLLAEITQGSRSIEGRAAALRVLRTIAGVGHGLDPAAWREWRSGPGRLADLSRFGLKER